MYLRYFGWDRWIRTIEMPESKSGALPLGYIPIFATNGLYHKICLMSIINCKNAQLFDLIYPILFSTIG